MKKNIHHTDKIFKEALDDLQEAPPSTVWESLNHDLDKKQADHFRRKYYRLKRTALLLLLLVFSSAIYMIYFSKAAKNDLVATAKNNSVSSLVKDNIAAQPASAESAAQKASPELTPGNKDITLPADTKSTKGNFPDSGHKRGDASPEAVGGQDNIQANGLNAVPSGTKNEKLVSSSDAGAVKANTIGQSKSHGTKLKEGGLIAGGKKAVQVPQKDIIYNGNAHATGKPFFAATANEVSTANTTLVKAGNNKPAVKEEIEKSAGSKPIRSLSASLVRPPLDLPLIGQANVYSLQPFYAEQNERATAAQTKPGSKTYAKGQFSLTAFAAPNHSFMSLENDNQLAGPWYNKNEAKKSEQQGSSYSAGILVGYGLGKHIILQTGIVFSSATTKIAGKTIYAKPDNTGRARYEFSCSSGYSYLNAKNAAPTVGDSIHVMGSSSNISYISVPVSLNYALYAGKFTFMPGIGFSINFLTNGHSATSFRNTAGNQKETAPIDGLKTAYIDGSFGLDLAYKLNKRISVGIRPLLRMAITSINKNTPVRSYQNFASLETGLKINL